MRIPHALFSGVLSNRDALDFVEQNLIAVPIVELLVRAGS
jgi:hypothetical protein